MVGRSPYLFLGTGTALGQSQRAECQCGSEFYPHPSNLDLDQAACISGPRNVCRYLTASSTRPPYYGSSIHGVIVNLSPSNDTFAPNIRDNGGEAAIEQRHQVCV